MPARSSRPFRFGVRSFDATSATKWRERPRRAEDPDYATLSVAVHHFGPGEVVLASRHRPVGRLRLLP